MNSFAISFRQGLQISVKQGSFKVSEVIVFELLHLEPYNFS